WDVERDHDDHAHRQQEGSEREPGEAVDARVAGLVGGALRLGRLALLWAGGSAAADVRGGHSAASASASAISRSTSSPYSMPRYLACSGTRLSGVMPGWVLISSR